jgi:membrane protease subunit HflK
VSPRAWAVTIGTAAALAYATTGLTVIQQDEVGVVRRLGAVTTEPYRPGLHWGWPWGLERVDRLKVDQARTLAVGARDLQSAPLSRAPDPASDEFLTGDLNLVTAQALVQFRVTDPVAYMFASRSSDAALAALAEGALTDAMAGRAIDDVLTTGRAEVAERLRRELQGLADGQGLGVSVRAVRLGRVAPPAPVAPAFADAARARSDRRQAVTKAEEYRDKALADARGKAREALDRAEGRRETAVQAARGAADRFTKVLAEVRKGPRAARQRLYLEALAELLPRFTRKVVVPPGRDVDLSVFSDTPQTPAPAPERR